MMKQSLGGHYCFCSKWSHVLDVAYFHGTFLSSFIVLDLFSPSHEGEAQERHPFL